MTKPAERDIVVSNSLLADLRRFGLLSLATLAASSLIFEPIALWPLAFICLAPWAYGVVTTSRPWVIHWLTFLLGWGFFLINLHWLEPVTGIGYVALAFYLALYWSLTAWAIRTALRWKIPVVISLPVAWVACEYMRTWVMSGFPWLFLAHSMYRQTILIQIADLTGTYGVSFLAAAVSGFLVDVMRRRWSAAQKSSRRTVLTGGILVLALLIADLGYGGWRLSQNTLVKGPRIAVVQEDFPLVTTPPYGDEPEVVFARYLAVAARAAAEKPDLLAFPETTWNAIQNIEFLEVPLRAADEVSPGAFSFGKRCHQASAAFARGDYGPVNQLLAEWEQMFARVAANRPDLELPTRFPRLPESGPPTALVVGAIAIETYPEATYPRQKRFNSALVYDGDGTQRRQRYDKSHLVPFGESVPFRDSKFLGLDMHWLYRWLNKLSPFSNNGAIEYSLWPGKSRTVFDLRVAEGNYRFGTPICYEDVMPYLVRDYVWGGGRRRVDFLVSISNDGWFLHSGELPQHLAATVFRAVENRIGIARSVNTGFSGFVSPNGSVYDLVSKDGRARGPGIVGYKVASVWIDSRDSLYGRVGDWFARLCLAAACVLWVGAVVTRWLFHLQQRIAALLRKGRGA